ncbi:hypothetical protein Mapa_008551 [Marchantia paleacea]|nr:hypothetical protein Mapa_008551 [Marchantia paleacea]
MKVHGKDLHGAFRGRSVKSVICLLVLMIAIPDLPLPLALSLSHPYEIMTLGHLLM